MSSTATVTKPLTAQTAPSPIEPLNTESARWCTRLHPGLVLAVYAVQFKAIVADPVSALLRGLLPLCILQVAYVAICLPPTGANSTPAPKPGSRRNKQPPNALSRTLSLVGGVANRTVVVWPLCLGYTTAHADSDSSRPSFPSSLPSSLEVPCSLPRWYSSGLPSVHTFRIPRFAPYTRRFLLWFPWSMCMGSTAGDGGRS